MFNVENIKRGLFVNRIKLRAFSDMRLECAVVYWDSISDSWGTDNQTITFKTGDCWTITVNKRTILNEADKLSLETAIALDINFSTRPYPGCVSVNENKTLIRTIKSHDDVKMPPGLPTDYNELIWLRQPLNNYRAFNNRQEWEDYCEHLKDGTPKLQPSEEPASFPCLWIISAISPMSNHSGMDYEVGVFIYGELDDEF